MLDRIDEHLRVTAALREHVGLLGRIADRIAECFRGGGRLYLFGNGGSAADAQHVAAELVGRFQRDRRALPAVALTTDTSALTAVGNDFGFENVFARQVEALATDRDVVWALSVSGTSPNIIRGLETARRIGAFRIGFTGQNGAKMRDLCDLCLMIDHTSSDRVQEAHALAYHLICDAIEAEFADQ
jgi:D-sedoheptulose 7-phosphate isomerase